MWGGAKVWRDTLSVRVHPFIIVHRHRQWSMLAIGPRKHADRARSPNMSEIYCTWNPACQNIFHAIISHHQGNHLPALGRNHQRSNQSTVAAYGKVDFGAALKSTSCKTKDFRSNRSICIYRPCCIQSMFADQGALPSPRQSEGIHPCVVAILGCTCWRSGRYETMICRCTTLQPFCVARVEVLHPQLPHGVTARYA